MSATPITDAVSFAIGNSPNTIAVVVEAKHMKELEIRCAHCVDALKRISAVDYRVNRSAESVDAYNTLRRLGLI